MNAVTIGADCAECIGRGVRCAYHCGVADERESAEQLARAELATRELALWFDLTCPLCGGHLELVTGSPPHDSGRRTTAVCTCTACSRSSLVVVEVQDCATFPSARLPR